VQGSSGGLSFGNVRSATAVNVGSTSHNRRDAGPLGPGRAGPPGRDRPGTPLSYLVLERPSCLAVERPGYVACLFSAGRRRYGRRVRLGELVPSGNLSPSFDGNGYRPSAQRPHRLRVQLRRKGPKIDGILGTLSRRCARWVAFPRDLPTVRPDDVAAGRPCRCSARRRPVHRGGTGVVRGGGCLRLPAPSAAIRRVLRRERRPRRFALS
jgi:hypothetical protein